MILALALGLPLLLALLAQGERVQRLLPFASLPFLALALLPDRSWELDWLMLGVTLGTDTLNRPFLLLLGSAWSTAAWFAMDRLTAPRFRVFWLLTLAGIGLAFLAQDLTAFYAGYAVMTLAGYGLVVHNGTDAARRAARIYLILGLLGEVCIVSGLFLFASQFGNLPVSELATALARSGPMDAAGWLLFVGFAVKMGMLPVHVWLPLAHPVAPVPASAVLSGIIVKAGLLGWLRLVPAEVFTASAAPFWLAMLGLAGAFYAALVALTQDKPKVILAWSTVSQMGLLLCLFAVSLWQPDLRPVLFPVLGLWVLHHGCNKAALFLAAGHAPTRSWSGRLLFALPALALAGAPLTGGALAKAAAKDGLALADGIDPILTLVTLSSITTSLLLLHLYRSMHASADSPEPGIHPSWPTMVALGLALPWLWMLATDMDPAAGLTLSKLWAASWPILIAALLLLAWLRLPVRPAWSWPQDDWLALLRHMPLIRLTFPLPASIPADWSLQALVRPFNHIERLLTAMPVVGTLLALLAALIWWALASQA